MNEISKYIPLDKSWIIRMGVLDITHNYYDIIPFLEKQNNLGDDLKSLYRACVSWKNNEKQINVGESGTLYRFLSFASWEMGLDKEFIVEKTLKDRVKKMCNNPEMVNWPLEELLKLDNGTSQRASASVLMGKNLLTNEEIKNFPSKLQLSYKGREHWNVRRFNKACWDPRYDKTIENHARAFVKYLDTSVMDFVLDEKEEKNPENYPFMRIFKLITAEEGELKWPSLRGHETDRIKEMEKIIQQVENNEYIISKDHRGVQAGAMKQMSEGKEIKVKDRTVVNKAWPQFWDFLEEYCSNLPLKRDYKT